MFYPTYNLYSHTKKILVHPRVLDRVYLFYQAYFTVNRPLSIESTVRMREIVWTYIYGWEESRCISMVWARSTSPTKKKNTATTWIQEVMWIIIQLDRMVGRCWKTCCRGLFVLRKSLGRADHGGLCCNQKSKGLFIRWFPSIFGWPFQFTQRREATLIFLRLIFFHRDDRIGRCLALPGACVMLRWDLKRGEWYSTIGRHGLRRKCRF